MPIKIIYNREKNCNVTFDNPEPKWSFGSTYRFLWGKACQQDKNTFEIQQRVVTCKDYVVDTFFKQTANYTFNSWTKAERMNPCFYIICQDQEWTTRVIDRVNNYINPFLNSKGFDSIAIHQPSVNPKDHELIEYRKDYSFLPRTLFFTYDPKLITNATIYSLFLSIFRYYIYTPEPNITTISLDSKDFYYCNEISYYHKLKYKASKNFIILCFNNPQWFVKEIKEEEFKKSGCNVNFGEFLHGQSGLFNLITGLEEFKYYKTWESCLLYRSGMSSYFGQKIVQLCTNKDYNAIINSEEAILNLTNLVKGDNLERTLQSM